MSERVKEIIRCPRPGCDGIAYAWVDYPDAWEGGGTDRIVHEVIVCRTCEYSGPYQAASLDATNAVGARQ